MTYTEQRTAAEFEALEAAKARIAERAKQERQAAEAEALQAAKARIEAKKQAEAIKAASVKTYSYLSLNGRVLQVEATSKEAADKEVYRVKKNPTQWGFVGSI